MEERRGNHTVYNVNYHFVWTPKYRRTFLWSVEETFSDAIAESVEGTDIEVLSEHIASDHVHLFVLAPPKYAPADIARRIKSITARRLWDKHADVMELLYWGGGCWERAYYVGTAGTVSATTIRQYIHRTNHT